MRLLAICDGAEPALALQAGLIFAFRPPPRPRTNSRMNFQTSSRPRLRPRTSSRMNFLPHLRPGGCGYVADGAEPAFALQARFLFAFALVNSSSSSISSFAFMHVRHSS